MTPLPATICSSMMMKRCSLKCQQNYIPLHVEYFFQKQHLENIGLYHEEFLRHEDKELRSRFDKIYKVGYLNQYLYRYRQHPNNITKDKVLMKHFASMLDKQ